MIEIAAALIAIVTGLVGMLHFFRQRQYSTHKISVKIGPENMGDGNAKLLPLSRDYSKSRPSFFIIGAEHKKRRKNLHVIRYVINNFGGAAMKNVQILLSYNSYFAVQNEFIEEITPNKYKEEVTKIGKKRKVQINQLGGACIIFEFPHIRPGEQIIFDDVLKFDGGKPHLNNTFWQNGINNIECNFENKKTIQYFVPITLSILMENGNRFDRNVFYIKSNLKHDERAIGTILADIEDAFWFGFVPNELCQKECLGLNPLLALIHKKMGKSGRLGWRRSMYRYESGYYFTTLQHEVRTKNGTKYNQDSQFQYSMQRVPLDLPNCDYSSMPSYVDSHMKLMMWLGYFSKEMQENLLDSGKKRAREKINELRCLIFRK